MIPKQGPDPEWYETWQLILGLWPDWKPTPQTVTWLWERWQNLSQDKLRDAVKQHRMEPSAEKAGRPVYNRINDLYIERTAPAPLPLKERSFKDTARPLSDEELREWDAWAARVLFTATPSEIADARERIGVTLKKDRYLAVAIDYCRNNPIAPSQKSSKTSQSTKPTP